LYNRREFAETLFAQCSHNSIRSDTPPGICTRKLRALNATALLFAQGSRGQELRTTQV